MKTIIKVKGACKTENETINLWSVFNIVLQAFFLYVETALGGGKVFRFQAPEKENEMGTVESSSIGARLKLLREEKKLSQGQLAEALSFGSKGMVSSYESGKRQISMTALFEYSDYFHVSTDWILRGNTAPAKSDADKSGNDGELKEMKEIYFRLSHDLREVALEQLRALSKLAK